MSLDKLVQQAALISSLGLKSAPSSQGGVKGHFYKLDVNSVEDAEDVIARLFRQGVLRDGEVIGASFDHSNKKAKFQKVMGDKSKDVFFEDSTLFISDKVVVTNGFLAALKKGEKRRALALAVAKEGTDVNLHHAFGQVKAIESLSVADAVNDKKRKVYVESARTVISQAKVAFKQAGLSDVVPGHAELSEVLEKITGVSIPLDHYL